MFEGFNELDFISGVLSVAFAILGVFYAYRCNGGKEGFDLIQKYVVLGWVVTIRCLLAFIPLMIVAYIGGEVLGIITDETGIFDIAFLAVFEIVLYQRIGRHIRDTERESEPAQGGNG